MENKFSIDELLIRVMPGGFFVLVILVIFREGIDLSLISDLDFFYTFLFFCSAFIVGELLQTLTRDLEWTIDMFFKCRRPSKVFLYKGNPVLKNENKRAELLSHLKLSNEKLKIFNKKYSDLSIWWCERVKSEDNLSQSIFWSLYTEVSDTDEIKQVNRSYLFVRVITMEFLLIGFLLLSRGYFYFSITSFLIFLLFLWRARGVARGLVFKTVLLNLKK